MRLNPMMLRGLWKLTWIEIKIFLREPLGAIGTIVIPVLVFIGTGRVVGPQTAPIPLPPAISSAWACLFSPPC